MTYREFLEKVIEANVTEEITNFATKEIEKMDAKNAKKRNTLSPNQQNNEAMKNDILAFMEEDKQYVASEIAKQFEVSTQKISALMKALSEKGLVSVETVKSGSSKVKGYTLTKSERIN